MAVELNVHQQTLALSLQCNTVNRMKGTREVLQKALRTSIAAALPRIDAGWTLAWGPAVYKKTNDLKTGPDNSWYIAHHPALAFRDEKDRHPTYVVAIAGAPANSNVAREETQGVGTVTNFNDWVAGGIEKAPVAASGPRNDLKPYIATGTVNTVHLLLNTPAPDNSPSPGQTLLGFIAEKSGSGRFIFTGHGLGGTLSPALALALVEGGKIPSDSTLTYPTAGASPGNAAFAVHFARRLPPKFPPELYRVWNLNVVNSLDIMPRAWSLATLPSIPSIYGGPGVPEIIAEVESAKKLSLSSSVLYEPLQSLPFPGVSHNPHPSTVQEFKDIAYHQHISAYISRSALEENLMATVADGTIVPNIIDF